MGSQTPISYRHTCIRNSRNKELWILFLQQSKSLCALPYQVRRNKFFSWCCSSDLLKRLIYDEMNHALAITDQTSQLSSDWNPWMTVRCKKLHLTRGNSSKSTWNPPRRLLTLPACKARWHLLSSLLMEQQKMPAATLRHGYAGKGHGLACVWGSFLAWHIEISTQRAQVTPFALGEVWTSSRIGTIHSPKHSFFEIPLSTWEIQWHMNYWRTAPFCRGTWRPGCPRTPWKAVVALNGQVYWVP